MLMFIIVAMLMPSMSVHGHEKMTGKHECDENENGNAGADSKGRGQKDKDNWQYTANYHPKGMFICFHNLKFSR